ncbi:sensor histidine kinase [Peptostreptococcus canis]|uniref:histidine kinase n=1 Tax=Peptostreptococcus canis TaxID=1159213 RepID=A0ABR6TM50_9FIRM|nr:ATP-binding protein [Peptostreptococcus canis]MBC2576502.1 two-component sensor histidine kinase [Peptostreptococcus canis]MBP1998662.1 signal transduction histidine kinase [Peptostreptococcus canis]
MKEKCLPSYLDICIGYRILTLVISTIVYFATADNYGSLAYWGVALGMCSSCLISSWIYKKIAEYELWLRLMFTIEVVAHSIFIFLSGGFSSPYLWYQIGCILTMIALEKSILITLMASLWSFSWAAIGVSNSKLSYQELNVCLGMIMTIGGFYVLRFYIGYIDKQNDLLASLNKKLEYEKEKSEEAFTELTNLHETFNLFAMTNPSEILKELSVLLRGTVANSGCILLKFDANGEIELNEIYGIDKKISGELIEELCLKISENIFKDNSDIKKIILGKNKSYEANIIGKEITCRGALIRELSNEENEKKEEFYLHLIEIIFKNLDVYSQMEKFIIMQEQNRIANEIHDTVIQKLFGIVCSLKVFESDLDDDSKEELKSYIGMLKKSVESTMSELRESIYGRSFKETINTFIGTLEAYMQEVQNLSSASIILDIDSDSDYMTAAQKIAIYRISCEAVNNAIRHGKANNISLKLKLDSKNINLVIEDDGIGFSKEDKEFLEGNGLKNMRNITSLLKGTVALESKYNIGTKIKFNLPR